MSRVFFDTSVLVSLFDNANVAKLGRARIVLEEEAPNIVLSPQVLSEFYVIVTQKLAKPLSDREAEAAARDFASFEVTTADKSTVIDAIATARRDQLHFWDALLIESARQARCSRMLTEDMPHGRRFDNLTV